MRNVIEFHESKWIQFPDSKKTIVDIADIKFNCFKTENEVRNYLMENTRASIDRLLSIANELKNEAYGVQTPDKKNSIAAHQSKNEEFMQQESDPDIIKVDLGNGQTGKLKVEDLTRVKK